ncbi:MAG: acetylornithine/succinylornithine family transaminase [Candidatus Kapabacteria bacterium]|nr:acetylornithine/succinylornithine family transaminase [Ignavibacteriota bacterium]MCW5886279.1 acetylornithine/succinylornithine family transaminase [Candidatus Kapabacteria bacterium]
MNNIIEREHNSIYQTYKRLPIVISRAEGVRIFAENGDVYLDFLSGIAVNALGHSHPRIIEAAEDQLRKYMHVSNYFYQEPQIELAEKLVKLSGLNKVFFCNSGTEATEAAMKLTRKWANPKGKTEILAFTGGFHGRTYAALSIMDKPNYKNGMGPFLDGCKVLPLNDVASLMASINSGTAAVCIEYIQGEGGISEPSREFNEMLNELHIQHGFLLIADEVQSGIGRSGKFFAFEHFDAKPDIITVAKGMGGGLPLGGIITSEELSEIWEKGNHGTTYGGNAVACRTGSVVIDVLEEGLLNQVNEIGNYFHTKLSDIKDKYPEKVLQVRGRGLMKGLLLSFDAQILVNELLERFVISNAASGSVLRIVPPLIVNKEEIDEFISKLDESLPVL